LRDRSPCLRIRSSVLRVMPRRWACCFACADNRVSIINCLPYKPATKTERCGLVSTGANMEKEASRKKARNSPSYWICLDILSVISNS
jgi:hypothetical protein